MAKKKSSPSFLLLKSSWFRKGVKYIWILLPSGIVVLALYIFSVSINLFGLFGEMPSLRDVENPATDLSSEIISADGVSLGRYFRFNRSQVAYDQLSPDLINTLLYSEDHRFYDHSGLDFQSFIRVAFGIITFNSGAKGGGSTLTQQIAKNLFSTRGSELDGYLAIGPFRIVINKTKEWIIAVQLERNFTKEELIAMYLNTVPFASNAYGIQVASETYFGKHPGELNIAESAVLVGILQSNTLFNPRRNPNNSLRKRNQILAKLLYHDYINKAKYDSLIKTPIVLNYKVQNQNTGLSPYFQTAIEGEIRKWAKERNIDLLNSGLRIYTTIDSRMQRYAEEAVAEAMRAQQTKFNNHWRGRNPWIDENRAEIKGFLESRIKQTEAYRALVEQYGEGDDSVRIMLKKKKQMRVFTWRGDRDTLFSSMDSLRYYKQFLNAGFMAMDPTTGAIKAWVGGINHKYFKFDHVRLGKRQPGSLFKSFVYGTAIEQGYSPFQKMQDISPTFKLAGNRTWSPANAGGDKGTGASFTMRQAMARSLNSITAQVLQKVGEQNVVDFARRAGVSSRIDPVPALCLGVSDCSLFELVGAYCTFVNLGIYTQPFYITRIEDRNGNVLQNFAPKIRQAISEQTAYTMTYMLRGGVEEDGGTSGGLPASIKLDNQVGGKTGTTNSASDGWFMGVTHNLVAGAWVGGDERSIHYRDWAMGSGGQTARPIWSAFMSRVYADKELGYPKGRFKQPASMDITLDPKAYEAPRDSANTAPDKSWEDPNH